MRKFYADVRVHQIDQVLNAVPRDKKDNVQDKIMSAYVWNTSSKQISENSINRTATPT